MLISGTVALLAAGTGISLAATQGSSNADSVTCIVVVDAKAAVDANSALSDVFPVGTPLHLTSAGRQVDVTVSAPITAAAPTSAAPTSAAATTAAPTDPASADPTATATSAPASSPASGKPTKPGKKHHHHGKATPAKPAAKPTASASATESNAEKAAKVGKVSIKAASNGGVDPNTVCVQLSKNAFNTLGNVVNGNNVGAFLATMTPGAAGAGNGAGAGQSAAASPTASATSAAGQAGNGQNAGGQNAGGATSTKGGKTHHKNNG